MLKRMRELSLDQDLVSPSTMAALIDLSQRIDHGLKFDDIRNRIVITEDLMRDLRISGMREMSRQAMVAAQSARDPPYQPGASKTPAQNNMWHRSHANSAAILYRQSRRYTSSRASFPPVMQVYKPSKNSRELPIFPELSANQCQLFAKHKFLTSETPRAHRPSVRRRRPHTEPAGAIGAPLYQHILCDDDVRRFQQQQRDMHRAQMTESPTKSTAEFKLPEIQTPTPSVRERYIVKWLYAENGRSPYISADMNFRLRKVNKKKERLAENEASPPKEITNTPITPFVNDKTSNAS